MELFTARTHATRRIAWPLAIAILLLLTAWYTLGSATIALAADATLQGRVWEDVDADGHFDAGEPAWADQAVEVFTADGTTRLTRALTGPDGRYSLAGIPAGRYLVKYAPSSWLRVRDTYHPTTLEDVWPESVLDVSGTVTFDLGWTPTHHSTDASSPLSTATSADGTEVLSYTDAVPASRVADVLAAGLVGGEGALTTLRFGLYENTSYCATSVGGSPGSYGGFSANCHVSYEDWVYDRHATLFHEYGHAWANYHSKIVQQTGDYADYLEVRGLTGDSRLGSSHAWTPGEMIAEDYRQLFGTPFATTFPQENSDIAPAAEVPGLAEYLSGTFMGSATPVVEPTPTATTDPTASPTSDPTTSTTTDLTTEPVPQTTTDPAPSPTTEPAGLHVSSLTADTTSRGNEWRATVKVEVKDGDVAASGVLVRIAWESDGRHGGSGSLSCTTGDSGTCVVSLDLAKRVSSIGVTTTTPSEAHIVVSKP